MQLYVSNDIDNEQIGLDAIKDEEVIYLPTKQITTLSPSVDVDIPQK